MSDGKNNHYDGAGENTSDCASLPVPSELVVWSLNPGEDVVNVKGITVPTFDVVKFEEHSPALILALKGFDYY